MKTTEAKRLELIQKIAIIEDMQLLEQIAELLQEPQEYELTDEQKKELEKRLENHAQGRSKSYTWEEVKADLK